MEKAKRRKNKAFIWWVCLVITCVTVSCTKPAFASGLEITLTGGDWTVSEGGACAGTLRWGLCWYQGAAGETCDTVCVGRGGCKEGNWDDDTSCTVCKTFNPGVTNCYSWAGWVSDNQPAFPAYYYYPLFGPYCIYRDPAGSVSSQSCGEVYDVNHQRLCACNTGSQATIGPNQVVSTLTSNWTITGATDGTEDILARVSAVSPSDWTVGTTVAANRFKLERIDSGSPSTDLALTGSDWTIKSALPRSGAGSYAFGLRLTTPLTGSGYGPHRITITLTATNFTKQCPAGAYLYDTDGDGIVECWFKADKNQSCATKCSNVGATCVTGNWNDDTNCTVMKNYYPTAGCTLDAGTDGFWPGTNNPSGTFYYNDRRTPAGNQDCNATYVTSYRICACDLQ